MTTPALSFVIPLYRSAETIGSVVHEIEALAVEGGHEIILVDDGSGDGTADTARALVRTAKVPITFVEHARNYGSTTRCSPAGGTRGELRRQPR
jgi:undecaprenyl-phosphate 4-deoxy-4-formamido-L-arabinose transferase